MCLSLSLCVSVSLSLSVSVSVCLSVSVSLSLSLSGRETELHYTRTKARMPVREMTDSFLTPQSTMILARLYQAEQYLSVKPVDNLSFLQFTKTHCGHDADLSSLLAHAHAVSTFINVRAKPGVFNCFPSLLAHAHAVSTFINVRAKPGVFICFSSRQLMQPCEPSAC